MSKESISPITFSDKCDLSLAVSNLVAHSDTFNLRVKEMEDICKSFIEVITTSEERLEANHQDLITEFEGLKSKLIEAQTKQREAEDNLEICRDIKASDLASVYLGWIVVTVISVAASLLSFSLYLSLRSEVVERGYAVPNSNAPFSLVWVRNNNDE